MEGTRDETHCRKSVLIFNHNDIVLCEFDAYISLSIFWLGTCTYQHREAPLYPPIATSLASLCLPLFSLISTYMYTHILHAAKSNVMSAHHMNL